MSDDRTRLIGEQAGAYPLDPAAAEGEETCPHCGDEIPSGEQFCLRCGYQRGSWKPASEAATEAAAAGGNERSAAPAPPWSLEFSDGRQQALPLGETVIGRGAVDVVLADNYASRRHARLLVEEAKVTLLDLGSANGTLLGDRRLSAEEEVLLKAGDAFSIGQTTLRLAARSQNDVEAAPTEPQPEEADRDSGAGDEAAVEAAALEPAFMDIRPAASPWSMTRDGALEFELPYGTSSLGRKPDMADLVLRGDGYISGLHARFIATEDTLEVCDLGSTNGTYVNGERCEPSRVVALHAGDMLRVGQTDLQIACVPRSAEPATEAAEPEPPAS